MNDMIKRVPTANTAEFRDASNAIGARLRDPIVAFWFGVVAGIIVLICFPGVAELVRASFHLQQ